MNRFKISNGNEKNFEKIWKSRDSYLDEVDGFLGFNLVKGESNDRYTLYASHSTWRSEGHFKKWTKSEEFRKAHKNAGKNGNLYLDHPKFEGFTVVL